MARKLALLSILTITANPSGYAQDSTTVSPEARGLEIAEEADRRDRGFGDSVTEIVMRLISQDGRVNE
ncbi:MAG TPA: outer membrane lipoprotein-sorting protein, partial [Gammaproteobacteria bacterium]|nr:outer membrane lipoprotein-sorting protein [Gammaproteobacteria bacterium]